MLRYGFDSRYPLHVKLLALLATTWRSHLCVYLHSNFTCHVVRKANFTWHSYNQNMHFVYVLQRTDRDEKYIGYTTDVARRLIEHNAHHNPSTSHAEWKLIYYEAYLDKMDALGREKFLKSGSGWHFLKKQLRHYLEHP